MKTKKKFLTILLTVCLVMAMIPMTVLAADEVQDSDTWDGSVATAFAGGTGAAEDPYQISSGAELAYLASAVNSGKSQFVVYNIVCIVTYAMQITHSERKKEQEMNC